MTPSIPISRSQRQRNQTQSQRNSKNDRERIHLDGIASTSIDEVELSVEGVALNRKSGGRRHFKFSPLLFRSTRVRGRLVRI